MKKKIQYFAPDKRDTTSFFRIGAILPFIYHEDIDLWDISDQKIFDWTSFVGIHALIFQRPFGAEHLNVILGAKNMGVKIITDYDDMLLSVNIYNPTHLLYKNHKESLLECLKQSDEIWVSTNAIRESYLPYNKNIHIIPNALNDYLFPIGKKKSFNMDSQKVFWRGGACFDEETEVLTYNGFKFFKDLIQDDLIATRNENGKLEYSEIEDYIEYHHQGDMHYYKTIYIDSVVTPNHKIYSSSTRHGEYELKRSDSEFGKKKYFRMDCEWHGDQLSYFQIPVIKDTGVALFWEIDDFLKFFGFWLSDGWTWTRTKGVSGQSGFALFKGDEVTNEILRILDKYKFKYTKRFTDGDFHSVTICDCNLFAYLEQFGKSYEKFIPKWILNLNKEKLTLFLQWYLKGDGSHEWIDGRKQARIRAYTSSPKLVDGLIELAIKIGWAASVKNRGIRKNKSNKWNIQARRDAYDVSFLQNSVRNFLQAPINEDEQHVVQYDGMAYCVTVKNHTLYVRRNGKCYWSGNSHAADVMEKADEIVKIINENPNWDFNFCGSRFEYIEMRTGDNHGIVPYMSIIEFFRYFNFENPNACFFPLVNNEFNRGKSNISFLESSYAGSCFFGNKELPEFNLDCIFPIERFSEIGTMAKEEMQKYNEMAWQYVCDTSLLSNINRLRTERLLNI